MRPATFAAASQISGLTPNSLVYLYHHVAKRGRNRDEARAKEVLFHHFMEGDVPDAIEPTVASEPITEPVPAATAAAV